MSYQISKEWCELMAQLEGESEIGAGRLAFNPLVDGTSESVQVNEEKVREVVLRHLCKTEATEIGQKP